MIGDLHPGTRKTKIGVKGSDYQLGPVIGGSKGETSRESFSRNTCQKCKGAEMNSRRLGMCAPL